MSAVGLALIGAGPWGLTLARAAASLPDVELRWICDLAPSRQTAAAEFARTARLTGSLDEVLADPGVHGALVAVESSRHHAVGVRVLKTNRHLLVEKPMALSVVDATELASVAGDRRRVLVVDHLLLHHPAIRRARQLLNDGAVGRVLWMETNRLATGSGRSADSAWWTLAAHDVSLVIHLFDALPVRVAAAAQVLTPGGGELVAWATLYFADNRVAHVHVGRRSAVKRRGFSIVGTTRTLTFDELAHEPALRIDSASGESAVESVQTDPGQAVDALTSQCREFVAGVARSDPACGNGPHALAVVRVLEAGEQSMRAGGTPVDLR